MNAEVDLVLGYLLRAAAAEQNVIITSDAGDQHGDATKINVEGLCRVTWLSCALRYGGHRRTKHKCYYGDHYLAYQAECPGMTL